MLRVFTNIKGLKKKWEEIDGVSDFLDFNFLKIFYKNHKSIKHLFIVGNNIRLYANIFQLKFHKTDNYLVQRSIFSFFLRFIRLDVLYLTNSFITNVPAFITDTKICIDKLLSCISDNYSLIIIPDFLFKHINDEKNSYTRIEVEEEMVLDINKEWISLDSYVLDLRKKYRNKIKSIFDKSSSLIVSSLDKNQLEFYAGDMQILFDQVVAPSKFIGPSFNTASFSELFEKGFVDVYGYFFDNRLVGFSSEINQDELLYSYYVGFDKKLNRKLAIYSRILLESIKNAIKLNKKKLVLGRTANEYKSNFGAIPIKSYIYLKVPNKYLDLFLRPIYTSLSVNQWVKRSPFRKKSF